MAFLRPTSPEAVSGGEYSTEQMSRMDPAFLKSLGLTRYGTPIPSNGGGSLSIATSGQRIASPDMSEFKYSPSATNYPTYMKQLGEANAQQAFQQQARYGAGLGNSVQGYMKAMTDRNNSRLNYMNQAGQAQMGVEGAQSTAHNQYQDQLAKIFGLNVAQRSDELNYLKPVQGGGSQWGAVLGRGGSGGSSGGGGGFVGLGGRDNPGIGTAGSMLPVGGTFSGNDRAFGAGLM